MSLLACDYARDMRNPRTDRSRFGRPARSMRRFLLTSVLFLSAGACSGVRGTDPPSAAPIPPPGHPAEAEQALVAKGRSQFLRCKSCHVVDAAAPPPFGDSLGPHLEHIVGRPAGSLEGFEYTGAVRDVDLVWDEETLDEWLMQPEAMVPGMCETFMGLPNPEHRRALIAYLKNPSP